MDSRYRSIPAPPQTLDIYAPDVAINKNFYVQQNQILAFILLLFEFSTIILIFNGRFRSRSTRMVIFVLSYYLMFNAYLISYIPGLMSTPGLSNDLYIFWMSAVAYMAAVTHESSCYTLADNEVRNRRLFVDFTVVWPLIFLSLYKNLVSPDIIMPIVIVLCVVFFKYKERSCALLYATTSSNGFTRATKIISDFTQSRRDPIDQTNNNSPYSNVLLGLREAEKMVAKQSHLAKGSGPIDFDFSNAITLDKILNTTDEFLSNSPAADNIGKVCRSFSMFSLLLAKMAGRDNVDDKLLVREDNQLPSYAFSLVELELQFLFEYLFTNRYAIYARGLWLKLLDVAVISMFLWLSIPLLVEYRSEDHNVVYIEKGDDACTKLIIITLVVIEIIQVYIIIFYSRLATIKYACDYVTYQAQETRWITRLILKVLKRALLRTPSIIINVRGPGQYSILNSYNKIPMIEWAKNMYMPSHQSAKKLSLINLRKASPKIQEQILDAVNNCLTDHNGLFTNGVRSLKDNEVADEVINTYVAEVISQTRVILIWHIVTCWFEDDAKQTSKASCAPSSSQDDANETTASSDSEVVDFKLLATTLSKYIAYLVVFVPRLIPDDVYTAKCEFDETIEELKRHYTKQDDNEDPNNGGTNHGNSVVEQARELKKILAQQQNLWKTLTDFWIERLLFLALSDHPGVVEAHADTLCIGKELITQLWALLTHAGCSKAPPIPLP